MNARGLMSGNRLASLGTRNDENIIAQVISSGTNTNKTNLSINPIERHAT